MVDPNIDQIVVVDYDPSWPDAFLNERDLIAAVLGDWAIAIEHIGSTAVPGLCAKPIIDIMVGVQEIASFSKHLGDLERLGYIYVPGDSDDIRLFLRKGMPRTHHLHIVVNDGEEMGRHILFRNVLRADPNIRERYANLKREGAIKFRDDRKAYLDSKTDLIRSILRSANLAQDEKNLRI
jgi:GrpB-like predicted nucleotidyltransferase (UPF0157 family)